MFDRRHLSDVRQPKVSLFAKMSENNSASKTPENKRKLNNPIVDVKIEKNARVKRGALPKDGPYEVEDVIDRLGVAIDTKEELDREIDKDFGEINKKYKDDLFVIDYKIKKLEAKKDQLIKARLNEYGTAQDMIFVGNRDLQCLNKDVTMDLLSILRERHEFFYPCDDCDNENLATVLNKIVNEGESYGSFGVGFYEMNTFKQFVVNNISVVKARAIIPSKGKMEGDGGEKTLFKVEWPVMVPDYPNARCEPDYDWDFFLDDHDIYPVKNSIKWNNPEGFATANFEFYVWVVRMKE